jgi:hypothetical protein
MRSAHASSGAPQRCPAKRARRTVRESRKRLVEAARLALARHAAAARELDRHRQHGANHALDAVGRRLVVAVAAATAAAHSTRKRAHQRGALVLVHHAIERRHVTQLADKLGIGESALQLAHRWRQLLARHSVRCAARKLATVGERRCVDKHATDPRRVVKVESAVVGVVTDVAASADARRKRAHLVVAHVHQIGAIRCNALHARQQSRRHHAANESQRTQRADGAVGKVRDDARQSLVVHRAAHSTGTRQRVLQQHD